MIRASLSFSHAGSRPAQEDYALLSESKGILVVADGFGGPVPGALASKTACESVQGFLSKEAGDLDATMPFELRSYFSLAGNVLFNALIHANRQVKRLNKDKGVHERGGASVIAGFFDEDLLALANVGACTAWIFRNGEARELCSPRTLARLIDPLAVDPAEELKAPLMAIGISEDLEPEIFEYRMQPGDWLMLATDGVNSPVVERIRALQAANLDAPLSPDSARQEIQAIFEQSGYLDNAAANVVIF